MYNKFAKAISIAILLFIIPNNSLAFDTNGLFKNLIKYSYPEVKVIQKDEVDKSTNKDNETTSNSDKTTSNQFVNVYVGKENIPTAKSEDSEGITLESSVYSSNMRVTNNKPQILIYHSHSCETYSDSPEGNYHSEDKDHSVMSVGCLLTNQLSNLGWGVVHSTTYHDSPTYNNSYSRSSETIKSVMNQYSDVNITIDLHRDGLNIADEATKNNIHKKYTTTVNGEKVAKFFFVVGARNDDVTKVQNLANGLTKYAKEKYPDLIMPVVVKPYGRFNQSICDNALLVEVGSNGTTTAEAQASAKYLAEILDGYFKEQNIKYN
ncbi:stage II sporulation protein P [Intestinibacter bartlettii]|uniref:Stage II sporulation protein P n=1 Tax=Intestinibacter bartlettii TaxID=261299 RepID=A0ABS6DXL5_9FIRM|nr:stage II sporulation protein P [Intestinibacter bartlettii]MBU5336477.1 stage II sporulation protein P [Intestinibacter bartlettii]